MRIAVMADIHGNRAALETCVAEARRQGAEEYLFLGDYLGEMAYPEKTLELLETLRKDFPCTFTAEGREPGLGLGERKQQHRHPEVCV